MIQGTASSAGKSLLVTALCRIFRRRGWSPAPFKSQNMALNSFVTADCREMGRAQAVQAQAAGLAPDVRMNPILLKPSSDRKSQVIVNGQALEHMDATEYFAFRPSLRPAVEQAFAALAAEHLPIVIEGAGSPAEINLLENDLVNMGMAALAEAPVILVADIDRGGVFAALYGTVMLLPEEDRARIKGFVINKFRGSLSILEPGIRRMEELLGIPCLGVLPFERFDIDDEDGLCEALTPRAGGAGPSRGSAAATPSKAYSDSSARKANARSASAVRVQNAGGEQPKISAVDDATEPEVFVAHLAVPEAGPDALAAHAAVSEAGAHDLALAAVSDAEADTLFDVAAIRLPRLSNFTDLAVFSRLPGVSLRWVERAQDLGRPDLLILPGSKSTAADLEHLRKNGLALAISRFARQGGPVFGICGGFQMLGHTIEDPNGVEGDTAGVPGLGLLDIRTRFFAAKQLTDTTGRVEALPGLLQGLSGLAVSGYEIHMGQSTTGPSARPLLHLAGGRPDGAVNEAGTVAGTYLHGIFDSPDLAVALIRAFGGQTTPPPDAVALREAEFERLADMVEAHLDMPAIIRIAGLE